VTRRAHTILGVLALSNLLGYAARNSLLATYDDLRAQYHVDNATLGLLATAFLVPHALATLPFGWGGDRYDRRRVIAVGLVLASIAGALGALAPTTGTLALSRALVGLGAAAIVPIGNSIIAQVFEGPRKASRMSVFNLGVFFGGVAGLGIGAAVGFPAVVVVVAIPSALVALLVATLPVPPHPSPQAALPLGAYLAELGRLFVTEGRELMKIRTLRWLMLSTTSMAFASGGYMTWLIDFVKTDKGMSDRAATSLLSVAGSGAIAGIITGARLADRLRAATPAGRLWTIALGMGGAVPCAVACIMLPPGPGLYAASIAMMFFFSWYHAPMAVSVDDLAPPARVAAAQGLVIFAMHLIGTAPAGYIVGLVADRSSLYTAMWVPTVALAIGSVAAVLATPSFARDHEAARGASRGITSA
jgi:predicted MFS family arabinose efflux permease